MFWKGESPSVPPLWWLDTFPAARRRRRSRRSPESDKSDALVVKQIDGEDDADGLGCVISLG